MSLDKALAGLTAGSDSTPTDVAMKLLEKETAIMHTEIRNVKVMNALILMEAFSKQKGYAKSAEVWKTLYDAQILHMVSYNRQRPKEIVKMFEGLVALLKLGQGGPDQKGGLFGRGR